MLADAAVHDTTIQVAIISTIGLIIVSIIGFLTSRITSGARKESRANADEASKSASIAKDYASALQAKNALIDSIEARLIYAEEHGKECTDRLEELELWKDESEEQRRAASLLERNQRDEIAELRAKIARLEKI